MSDSILQLAGVHTYYGPSPVLRGVYITEGHDEVVAVLGRNGMGKTTLIHTIAGLVKPREGTITLEGERIDGLAPWRIARRGLSLLPQGHRVFPSLTVAENLKIAADNGGPWDPKEMEERIPILAERRRQPAGTLSGGQQQMLTLARALVRNPKMLLLDEPSEGLDPEHSRIAAELITEARQRGVSILVVEQRVEFALGVADRVLILSKGSPVFVGTPDELRAAEDVQRQHLGVGA